MYPSTKEMSSVSLALQVQEKVHFALLESFRRTFDGEIIIDGAHLMDKSTDINLVRQHIGMVFQHFNLFPHLSILENIILAPMDLKKESREEAEKKQSNYCRQLV